MRGALLDTSVLIAGSDDVLRLPESTAISIITLGELYAGVALAGDDVTGAQPAARLVAVRRAFEPLVVDEPVAERCGHVLRAGLGHDVQVARSPQMAPGVHRQATHQHELDPLLSRRRMRSPNRDGGVTSGASAAEHRRAPDHPLGDRQARRHRRGRRG